MSSAMSSSVKERTSPLPDPDAVTEPAPDDPELVATCGRGHAILIQVQFMKMVKRIRSLKVRPTAERFGNVFGTRLEAMKTSASVEAVSRKFPHPATTEKAVSENAQQVLRLRSKRIRIRMQCLWKVSPPAAEPGYSVSATSDETAVEGVKTTVELETSRLQDPWLDRATEHSIGSTDRPKLGSLLCLSKRIRALVTVSSTTEGFVHGSDGALDPSSERYVSCPSSPVGSPDSQVYSTCPSSPGASSGSPSRRSTSAKLSAGRPESQIYSTCAASSSDSQKCSAPSERPDSLRNSDCAICDSGRSPAGGRSESRRHSARASSSNARGSPAGGKSESRRDSSRTSSSRWRQPTRGRSASRGHLRSHSMGVGYESQSRSYTAASANSRRFSTGARSYSQRSLTYANLQDSGRNSNACESDIMAPAGASSRKVLKALLTPSMSLSAFLSIMGAEEQSLGSPSDSRVSLGSTNHTRRSSTSEVFMRPRPFKTFQPSVNLEVSSGPEFGAPEDQDEYCDSNISWSSPLELDPPPKLTSPVEEEPRQSIGISAAATISSSAAAISSDHFSVYVGSERKKFVLSSQVVTHQLFQKLLASHENYKKEVRDGKISIVLLSCDADYFQRLLFLVDQRKKIGEEGHDATTNRSESCWSRRSCDFGAPPEPS